MQTATAAPRALAEWLQEACGSDFRCYAVILASLKCHNTYDLMVKLDADAKQFLDDLGMPRRHRLKLVRAVGELATSLASACDNSLPASPGDGPPMAVTLVAAGPVGSAANADPPPDPPAPRASGQQGPPPTSPPQQQLPQQHGPGPPPEHWVTLRPGSRKTT